MALHEPLAFVFPQSALHIDSVLVLRDGARPFTILHRIGQLRWLFCVQASKAIRFLMTNN
jgi:hypothetical protein